MEAVKGYKKLTPGMQELFNTIQHLHVSGVGNSNKEKLAIKNLKEIKVNREEKCFEAYYKHDWYKYYPNGTWG